MLANTPILTSFLSIQTFHPSSSFSTSSPLPFQFLLRLPFHLVTAHRSFIIASSLRLARNVRQMPPPMIEIAFPLHQVAENGGRNSTAPPEAASASPCALEACLLI